MGLIQDQRPRDWAYRVAFDRKDLPSLQEMVRHIRETHDIDMIERFNDNCEQLLKDKNPIFDGNIRPMGISKTDDLVVNVGLQQCINIILGTSAVRWSHILVANSSGAITPAITDTNVNSTAGGPFPLVLGWSEAKGMKLFFGCIGPQDTTTPLGTGTISDMGIFNGASGATMLNHENFFNNKLTRTFTSDLQVYSNVWIFSCVVEFCPVV